MPARGRGEEPYGLGVRFSFATGRPASWEAREGLGYYQFYLQRACVGSAGEEQAACLIDVKGPRSGGAVRQAGRSSPGAKSTLAASEPRLEGS